MKFKNYITNIENVNIFPIISLVLFSLVFLGVIIYVFSSNKQKMKDNANIPLK